MTNQQGAPEAPPPAFVHYPPKKPELARVDFLPIATKAERSNGWVTVALAAAQQPAQADAATVSDDLRDRLSAISEAIADQDDRAAQSMIREILKAPQADSQPAPVLDESAAPKLRAMAINYPEGACWDKLDAQTCMDGALEIEALRAARAPADSVQEDAARYRWLATYCRSTSGRGGGWSIVVDGPAPKSHDSEDAFDAAIDSARKQGGA